MNKYLTAKNIVIAVLVLGVIILLITLFRGHSTDVNQELLKQYLSSKDSLIKSYQENINLHERILEEKDRSLGILQQRDSVLNVHFNESTKIYNDLTKKIQDIPARIIRIGANDDSIRAAFKQF